MLSLLNITARHFMAGSAKRAANRAALPQSKARWNARWQRLTQLPPQSQARGARMQGFMPRGKLPMLIWRAIGIRFA